MKSIGAAFYNRMHFLAINHMSANTVVQICMYNSYTKQQHKCTL